MHLCFLLLVILTLKRVCVHFVDDEQTTTPISHLDVLFFIQFFCVSQTVSTVYEMLLSQLRLCLFIYVEIVRTSSVL